VGYKKLWRFNLITGFLGAASWGVNMFAGGKGGPIHMIYWRYTQLMTLLAFVQV